MNSPFQPPVQPPVQYVQVAPPKVAGLAIASLVLGIVSFFFGWLYLVPSVLAIIFGGVALHQIKLRNLGGKGMAIAGLVCGIISACIYGLVLIAAIASQS